MRPTPFLLLFVSWLACAASASAQSEPAPAPAAAQALHALFERSWQATAERFPEFATFRGDYRYNDRLADVSPQARQADLVRSQGNLAAARAIQP